MSETLHRQLNVLIVICSAILGIALTYLFLISQVGFLFFVFAGIPASIITFFAFVYVGN